MSPHIKTQIRYTTAAFLPVSQYQQLYFVTKKCRPKIVTRNSNGKNIYREKIEQGPNFPHSRREGSFVCHKRVISECCLRHRILCFASRTTGRQPPRLLRRCAFCKAPRRFFWGPPKKEGCHLVPSKGRTVDVRTAEQFFRLLGCVVTSHQVTFMSSASKEASWLSQMPNAAEVWGAVSTVQSNEFLCWRQHSLVTRCDKCTNLQGDYVEIRSLFSRLAKNAVLDKTRPNKQTFSLSVRSSYVAILSSFGAKKKGQRCLYL